MRHGRKMRTYFRSLSIFRILVARYLLLKQEIVFILERKKLEEVMDLGI